MSGDFGVTSGKFANRRTERDLTHLSDSSGKAAESAAGQEANVLSDLKGHGSAANGTATVSNLSFTIPAARAWIHGTYGLIDYKLNLHVLLTTGNPSHATTDSSRSW